MTHMREFGGYIELETFRGEMLHEGAAALNCGRSALAYLCEAKNIQKLYLPRFLCASVPELCKKINVQYDFYAIDERFMPVLERELGDGEWLYIVNFYGQLSNETLTVWKKRYKRVIVDNAQSYFQMPAEGVDTIYTCRKFFGVADGAFLYTDTELNREIPQDESFERMHFLLGRYERTANEFYSEYAANNKRFATEPVKRMSRLTENLLHGIDYGFVRRRRTENFAFLHEQLGERNRLALTVPDGAFMYPLHVENGAELRKKLQKEKIYIPTLWPAVLDICREDELEYDMAKNILPLPVDQRYTMDDMQYIVQTLICLADEKTDNSSGGKYV